MTSKVRGNSLSVVRLKLEGGYPVEVFKIEGEGGGSSYLNLPNRLWGLLGPQRTIIVLMTR